MRPLVSGIVVATCIFGPTPTRADALDDQLGPREIAIGEAMRGGAVGATAIALNPSGLPLNRELVLEGGYGYRTFDGASLISVSACDSTNAVPGCFFYGYAGSHPELGGVELSRSTHVGGLALSRMLAPRVHIGATAKYFRFESEVAGETDAKGFTFDLGATVRLSELINLGVSAQNLVSTEESDQFPRAIGGGILARPIPTFALGFDSRWKTEAGGGARFGGGAEYFLRIRDMGIPLRAGALHDTGLESTYLTAGIGVITMRFALDVGARREVRGGDETLILASMRLFGPRLAAPTIHTGY